MPALINITVPAGTLLGWSDTPADVGSWGLMDAETVRGLIEAASRHPRTRWCYTLTGPDGQAIAHACAPGSHPWPRPAPRARPRRPAGRRPRPAQLAGLLTGLNAAPEPVARGTCDHAHREDRYIPEQEAQAPDPRPHRPLLRARLRRPGHHLRDRPHRPLPRRRQLRVQPRPGLPAPPPRQARTRLEPPADRARRHALDHPLRPHLHHPPHPIRRMTGPSSRPARPAVG